MNHSLSNIGLLTVMMAWLSIAPAIAQNPAREARGDKTESGLDLLVVDQQGAVCAGAQVNLVKNGEAGTLRWNTDQEGRATIHAVPGDYWVTIKLPNFLDYQKRLTLRPGIRTALTATLWVGASDHPIAVPREDLIPVNQADTPLLELVPVPDLKPAKAGFRQRIRRLLHFGK